MKKTDERWETVKGYEGYEVSNFGNVRNTSSGKTLKHIRMNTGYYCVILKGKVKLVHRLVAEAFCMNNSGYTEVNFLNEDKSDCTAWNIEWCDRKWNNNWGTRNERSKSRVLRAVEMIGDDGDVVAVFKSAAHAKRSVTGKKGTANLILMCCKGKRNTAYGHRWRYSYSEKFGYVTAKMAEKGVGTVFAVMEDVKQSVYEEGMEIKSAV